MKIREIVITESSPIKISDARWAAEVKDVWYNDSNPNGSTRGLLSVMSPDTFLKLAASDEDVHSRNYGEFSNEKFNEQELPRLYVNSSFKVTGHEGRGRAALLQKHNMNSMPVIIVLDFKIVDISEAPDIITAEESNDAARIDYVSLLTYPLHNPLS